MEVFSFGEIIGMKATFGKKLPAKGRLVSSLRLCFRQPIGDNEVLKFAKGFGVFAANGLAI